MDITRKIADEVAALVPKMISGVTNSFFKIQELTNRQIVVLLCVYQAKQAKISDIARNFKISMPATTGIVERLVEGGYLIRKRDKDDRRVVFVQLSKKGETFAHKLKNTIRDRWTSILVHLDRREQEQYLNILRKIVKTMEAAC